MITVEINKTQLEQLETKLNRVLRKVPTVLKNAVNAAARQAKKDLANRAKKVYTVKKSSFDSSIQQKNATTSEPVAILTVSGESNPLSTYFKFSKNKGVNAARAKVKKSSNLKALQKGNLKAFIVQFESGHVAIVQRDPPKKYTSKGASKRRAKYPYSDLTKIKELFGPSIPQMIGNEQQVYGYIRPKIQENLQRQIHAQVEKILGGSK